MEELNKVSCRIKEMIDPRNGSEILPHGVYDILLE